MNTVALDEVLRRIHNLPSLPTVVMELLASLGEDDVNIDALALKIAQDQALTAKTLRLANSSFYGMANRVTTIHEAIAILGFRTVRSLATTAALMGTFSGHSRTSFNATPFWLHSIATAVCAKELAKHLDLNPEHAYIAGLLHDIGRLVLISQFQPHYEATMADRALHDGHLLDAEQAVLGLDHTVVGQTLTQHWKFPEAVQQAVASHHAPSSLDLPPLSVVVIAANVMAHALDLSQDPDDLVPPIPTGLWLQLGLKEKTLRNVLTNAEKQFEGASLVLNT
jgi:putative nucleotidyltransferase with HDIG domain